MKANSLEFIRKSQEKFTPEADRLAGQLGERLAEEALKKGAKKLKAKYHIYPSIRVPRASGQGKYEIDLLLVSEYGILAIEVKHWGGQLESSSSHWVQYRREQSKSLKDPVADMDLKKKALIKWLKDRKISIPVSRVKCRVVLSNENVNLGPKLQKHPAVMNLETLETEVALLCDAPKKKYFWQKRVAPSLDLASTHHLLTTLPTWDEVSLNGGRRYWGDLLDLKIQIKGINPLARSQVRTLKVRAFRNLLGLLIRPTITVESWDGKKTKYPLDPRAKVLLRHAGQARDEELSLVHIKELDLGWQNHSYYDR